MPDTHSHVGSQPVVKISKVAAEYEHPAKGEEHCGICGYFEKLEPDHCSRVKGIILKEDWCKLWEAK